MIYNSSTIFQCSYCDSNYAQKTNLHTHVKQTHEEKFDNWKLASNVTSKKFQCSYCDSKYSQKHNLKAHVKKYHDKNELKVDSSKGQIKSE